MEAEVRELFERYAEVFNRSLRGEADMEEVASQYASEFIAAGPAGVAAGKNDETLKQVIQQGFARYREIGTKEMRLRGVRISPIDDLHCLAHVAWTAVYARDGKPDLPIDFEVHYLLQNLGGASKVFGWISGDEQALMKQHGIG